MSSSYVMAEPSLGLYALAVKPHAPNVIRDHADMPKKEIREGERARLSPVALNLLARIGDDSVNAWSKRNELPQTTINKIVTGRMDPTVSNLAKIAEKLHVQPWELMAPPGTPVFLSPEVAEYAQLIDEIIRNDLDERRRWFARYMLTHAVATPPRKSAEILEMARVLSEELLPS